MHSTAVDLEAERKARFERIGAREEARKKSQQERVSVPLPKIEPRPKGEPSGPRKVDRDQLRALIVELVEAEPEISIAESYRRINPPLTEPGYRNHFQAALEHVSPDARAAFEGARKKGGRRGGRKKKAESTSRAPSVAAPARPARTVQPTGKESIRLASAVGEYAAAPVGRDEWEVELRVRVNRSQALYMNGQAWAMLFPEND